MIQFFIFLLLVKKIMLNLEGWNLKADKCYLGADLNKGVGKAGGSVANGHTLSEPQEGMVFKSEEAAMSFYAEYARQLGFLIHMMPCSPRGISDLSSVENQQQCSRTECQAMILLKCEKSGKCIVSRFSRDHCHPLVIFPEELGHTMVRFHFNLLSN